MFCNGVSEKGDKADMSIAQVERCTNCGSCLNECPKEAISISKDELFYRPVIDASRCVDCGLCMEVCPILNLPVLNKPIEALYGRHLDPIVIGKSSSGGAFSALASRIRDRNGVVFGAVYSDDFMEIVFDNSDRADMDAMRRSKYAESLIGCSMREIRDKLEAGKPVMFCGTPCQAAGLRNYLKHPYTNLLICDFICGGLPSHRLFQEYMHKRSEEGVVTAVNFRSKELGWSEYMVRIDYSNGKKYSRHYTLDPYFSAFLRGRCSVRENCLDCMFAEGHASDLTLADFWAWRNYPGIENDDRGLSLILVNTDRGLRAIEDPGLPIELKPLPAEDLRRLLNSPKATGKMRKKREQFLRDAQAFGLFKSAKLHTQYKGADAIKRRFKNMIKRHRR